LVLGACGGDDDPATPTASLDLNPTSTVETTGAPGPTTTVKIRLGTATEVADLIAAAGLGCADRSSAAPTPAPGYPKQKEFVNCTVSGRKAGISIYEKDGDSETALNLAAAQLCKQIGKAATEKLGVAYGPLFTVGIDNSDPAIAGDIAKATGGQVKRFTCP
jgi:hypothetical protein